MKVIETARFKVTVDDIVIKVEAPTGHFNLGVDNEGNFYVSTWAYPILVRPSASNRITLSEDRT